MSGHDTRTRSARPRPRGRGRDRLRQGRSPSASSRWSIFALCDRLGGASSSATRRRRSSRRPASPRRPPRVGKEEIGIVDQVPFDVDHAPATLAAEHAARLNGYGWVDAARASPTSRSSRRWTRSPAARCPRERRDEARAPRIAARWPLATLLARRRPRAPRTQVVFPQGSEQPLAALQDIDVIEHLGERVPAGLTFTDGAGKPVPLGSLLGRGKPVLVTLGYHRCPMLCGLVLDGLVKAAARSGLKLGKDFFAVDVSIDPAEDAKLLAADPEARARRWRGRRAPPRPTGRSGRRRPTAARRRASSPTRSASATSTTRQQAVRPRRGGVRADARGRRRPLPVRRRLPGPRLPHGAGRGRAAAGSAPRSTRC